MDEAMIGKGQPLPKVAPTATGTQARPSLADIPQGEWDAGHAIGSEVEGSPKAMPPTVTAKPFSGGVTPIGQGYLDRMRGIIAEHPEWEHPAPVDEDLTPQLEESLKQVRARKKIQ
jgi:hypothetical protein